MYNNYKYNAYECVRNLCRVAGFVRVLIPQNMVENISGPWNHPDQDVWIWPDGELGLKWFVHEFGTMNGTEDIYLKGSSKKSRVKYYHDISRLSSSITAINLSLFT